MQVAVGTTVANAIVGLSCNQALVEGEKPVLLHGTTWLIRTHNVTHTREAHGGDCVVSFQLRRRATRGNICNDPYLSYQGHLAEANFPEAWSSAADAASTHIIVVDDGIGDHLELQVYARFPVADDSLGSHATSVAGLSSSRNNGIGICGASPAARLVDINLLARTYLSDAAEALAFSGDHVQWEGVYCNSWGPIDDGRCDGPGPMLLASLRDGTLRGRGGRGSLYVFAAGNGGKTENMNDDGYANSPYTVAVAATRARTSASFSEWGAAITLSAPGYRLLTTALPESFGYFYGTSAAAPIVAGAVSLMLATNAKLGWRDVQEILMSSASRTGSVLHPYTRNSAGMRYSHHYGAGFLDAAAAVSLSRLWVPLLSHTNETLHWDGSGAVLPLLLTFPAQESIRVEHVRVCLQVRRADSIHSDGSTIGAWVESAQGTRAYLTRPTTRVSAAGCSYADWCFTSLAQWGEGARGLWTVLVEDEQKPPQMLHRVTLQLLGSRAPYGFAGCSR